MGAHVNEREGERKINDERRGNEKKRERAMFQTYHFNGVNLLSIYSVIFCLGSKL